MNDRLNSTGLPRRDLRWALTQPRIVKEARAKDACLLCRSGGLNESGLCRVCFSMLDEEETALARRWTQGIAN